MEYQDLFSVLKGKLFGTNNKVMINWSSTRKYYELHNHDRNCKHSVVIKFCKCSSAVNIARPTIGFELVNTARYLKF